MNIDDLIEKIIFAEISISEIARRANVSRKTIYNILDKKHNPSVDLFNRILKVVER